MNQFDKLYKQILNECNNKDIIDQWSFKQGWNNVKNVFKKKKPEEKKPVENRSRMCKKLWNEKNYTKLADEIKLYKKEKQFAKDPDAQFYYGMLLIKDLINENKLVLHTKNLLLETVTTDKAEEDEIKSISEKNLNEIYNKAKQGDKDALYNMAVCYYTGIPYVLNKDIKRAIVYFIRAAKKGCPEALYNLGVIYENGDKYGEKDYPSQDEKYALKCYKYAVKLGYKEAEEPYKYLLNKLYEGNKGQADDEEKKEGWERTLELEIDQPKDKVKIFNDKEYRKTSSSDNHDIVKLKNTLDMNKLTKGLKYIQHAANYGCEEAKIFVDRDLKKIQRERNIQNDISSQTKAAYQIGLHNN